MARLLLEVPEYMVVKISPKRTAYCICIPVINEGDRIRNQLSKMKYISAIADIILVDGGSSDGSVDVDFLKSKGVRALLIKSGHAKLSAQLRAAIHYAMIGEGYNGVITMDGNDKDGPEAIDAFIDKLNDGYDFVQGSRFLPGGRAINTPLMRHLAIKLIHVPLISWMAGFRYTDTTNNYRAYSKRLLLDDKLQIFREIFQTYELIGYLSVKVPGMGYRVAEIPVSRSYPGSRAAPTKISAVRGNLGLMRILFELLLHKYDIKG